MNPEALLPAYGGGSLAEVLPTICDGLRVRGAWDHFGLGEASRVVVIVVDGLGHRQLHDHAELAPTLAAADRGPITTVFPSTTPTALTSFGTGLPPGSHGLIGAAFRLDGALFAPLSWGDTPSAMSLQPQPTWWERAARAGVHVDNVSPRIHRKGGLTGAAFRGGRFVAADTYGERVAETARSVRGGSRSLVYSYWEGLDKTAHVHGVDSPHYRAELGVVDHFVRAVAAEMPAGSRLVVTADHGFVDCDTVIKVDGDEFLDGVQLLAGEPRVRQVYTRPGRADEVAGVWRERLADAADVLLRDDAIEAGLFGETSAANADHVGDVLAIARVEVRLAAPTRDSMLSSLRGQHGALTPSEMAVPLIVLDV